jgi:hypothetical protein
MAFFHKLNNLKWLVGMFHGTHKIHCGQKHKNERLNKAHQYPKEKDGKRGKVETGKHE